ncbi:hypothetical protein AWN76_004560 [Rhodothermaceae bacterium RA]|nr:hypothetical protein AWN76_004560 [Rhodothermaceae bacterium RA]
MGDQHVRQQQDRQALRRFTRQLIQDVRALEYMLHEGVFETGITRIGAEQEMALIDDYWQPAPVAEQVLEQNTDPRLVSELTRFNLEFNLPPRRFEGDCFGQIEQELNEMLHYVRALVQPHGARVALAGILPTIHLSDMVLDNMMPLPRYHALNEALMRLRGGPAQYQIRGIDELFLKHDSIMLEGCNTSFQTHLQVTPEDFPRLYNIAQVVAGPCLAAATNSPVLFGKRLWRETRIALFEQAVDTRSSNLYLREMSPRVHFGTDWVRESVMELFKEDIARFRVILATEDMEDPFALLQRGEIPRLRALMLHNGTVYRWNRACYGLTDGKPHLRIENRILPAGPTTADEVANAAFWFGLVQGLAARYDDITEVMDFDDAKGNFVAAASVGLDAQMTWLGGHRAPAPELICDVLVPLAEEGLRRADIDEGDIERYLGIIDARARSQQTGAQWMLESLARMRGQGTRADRLNAVTAHLVRHQEQGNPVHTWPLATLERSTSVRNMQGSRIEHFMTTDLFTVNEEELVELVACLMDWRRIRHVLVEDEQHRLVGLVTHRSLLRYLTEYGTLKSGLEPIPVRDIMIRNPIAVSPETRTAEAIALMRERKVGALPVVRDGQLVGIVTERDFIRIAGELLDDSMQPASDEAS